MSSAVWIKEIFADESAEFRERLVGLLCNLEDKLRAKRLLRDPGTRHELYSRQELIEDHGLKPEVIDKYALDFGYLKEGPPGYYRQKSPDVPIFAHNIGLKKYRFGTTSAVATESP